MLCTTELCGSPLERDPQRNGALSFADDEVLCGMSPRAQPDRLISSDID